MEASRSIPSMLHQLRTVNQSSPRLIWYGPNTERIELSGRVLDNWVAKTSNLLVEELDAVPGTRVALQLPGHWKTLVWALACWQVGAVPVDRAADPVSAPEIMVSSSDAVSSSQLLVLVALGALELKWSGVVPPGAVDYAAEVRGYGDEFFDLPPEDAHQTALEVADGEVGMAVMFDRAGACDWSPGGVLLVPADTSLETLLAAAVHAWTTDGTLVLVHPEVNVSEQLLNSERVTDRVGA